MEDGELWSDVWRRGSAKVRHCAAFVFLRIVSVTIE